MRSKRIPGDGGGLLNLGVAAWRRIVQVGSAIALHCSWGPEAKWLCNPVLSCHSCALSWFACPIGVFIHYAGYRVIPVLALGMVLLVGVLFGRLLCGWVCPFGLLQDLLYKIRSPKFRLPRWTSWIKYVVLVVSVLLLPFFLGESTRLSFCRFCPASALQVTIPDMLMGGGTVSMGMIIKLALLVAVLAVAVLSSRSFCKTLCPIGAMMAPMNYISFWKVKPPAKGCITCRLCDKICPANDIPSARLSRGTPANRAGECVVCHECQSACRPKS